MHPRAHVRRLPSLGRHLLSYLHRRRVGPRQPASVPHGNAQTDRQRRGQWAYIIDDHLLSPGFRLFLRMLELTFDARSQAPVAFRRRYFQLHDIPLSTDPPLPFDPALSLLLLVAEWHQLTVDNFTAFLPSPRSRIRYNAALTCLKSWAPYLGLDPSVLGAQSLLRGSASDHASIGLSDSQFASPSSWKHCQSSTALSSPPLLVTDNSLKSPLAPHFFYNDRGTSLALLLSFF